MSNPFYNKPNNTNFEQMRNIYVTLKNSNNPDLLIQNMINQNPQLAQTVKMLRGQNLNYEQIFRKLCSDRGLNPDDVIKNIIG